MVGFVGWIITEPNSQTSISIAIHEEESCTTDVKVSQDVATPSPTPILVINSGFGERKLLILNVPAFLLELVTREQRRHSSFASEQQWGEMTNP